MHKNIKMLKVAAPARHALLLMLPMTLLWCCLGLWPALAGAMQLDAGTPIIFSDKGARVLEDAQGSLTPDAAQAREPQFVPAKTYGPPKTDSHYWVIS